MFIGVIFKDGEEIAKNGFFDGYNGVVWTAIVFQALGGVLVAMCINYADNIAKNFATSISIIISFIFSVWVFDFKVTTNVSLKFRLVSKILSNSGQFIIGTGLVIFATYLYSTQESFKPRPAPIKIASYEKTTIDNGFTPKYESLDPLESLKTSGLSTSRPSSPMRHHSRVGSSRGKVKRDD